MEKKIMNLSEVAEFTGLSKSYLWKLSSSGGIPCFQPKGKILFFDRDEVIAWCLSNRKPTTEETVKKAATLSTIPQCSTKVKPGNRRQGNGKRGQLVNMK